MSENNKFHAAMCDSVQAPAMRSAAVKAKLAAYDAEQRRIAAEAEAKQQAELKALREKAEAEAAATSKLAAEQAAEAARLAAAAEVPVMDLGEDEPTQPTATQAALAALESAPAVVAPKPVGVSMRVLLVATVTDINKLPEQFIERTAKMAEIRKVYCNGWTEDKSMPECAGVKFEVSRTPISTGRPVF